MFTITSLRIRLIAYVSLILIGGFFATNIVSYQVSKGTLRTSILENELPLSSNNIYSQIQADLLQPIFVSSLMATDTFLKDWVDGGERGPEQITRYLSAIRDRYGAFTSYFISARSLTYYHFTGPARTVSRDDPNDDWFFRAEQLADSYEINLDDNEEQGRALTIFINYRVLGYDGTFIGVAGIGLALDSVGRLIAEYQESFRRSIYFADQNGLIGLHSDVSLAGKANLRDIAGLAELVPEILASPRGSYTYERDGETVLLTTRYIPELKWHLLIELNEAYATRELRHSFALNMGIGSIAIALTILLIGYTVNLFQRQLEEMATTDKLTGLGNRQAFEAAMGHQMARFKRTGAPFSLIMIDVDHFKSINDVHGHVVGDRAIRALAQTMHGLIRESDILCRWGGEEIVLLAPDCSLEDARQLAEKIRCAVRDARFVSRDPEWRVTVSAGVVSANPTDTADALLARADRALYRAKDLGRNRTETA